MVSQTAFDSAVEHAENGESCGSLTRSPYRRLTYEDYGGPAARRSSVTPEPCANESRLFIETAMSDPLFSREPEPVSGTGEILLSFNHIALLQALLDRPDAMAQSQRDWARAAVPYIRINNARIATRRAIRAMQSIHPRWVRSVRCGTRIVSQLTDRGREILELQVPVRVRGHGRYRGIRQGR